MSAKLAIGSASGSSQVWIGTVGQDVLAAKLRCFKAAFTRGMTSVAISSMDRLPSTGSTQSMPP